MKNLKAFGQLIICSQQDTLSENNEMKYNPSLFDGEHFISHLTFNLIQTVEHRNLFFKIEIKDTNNEYKLYSVIDSVERKNENGMELNFKNKESVILHHVDTRCKSLGMRLLLKNQTPVKSKKVLESSLKNLLEFRHLNIYHFF